MNILQCGAEFESCMSQNTKYKILYDKNTDTETCTKNYALSMGKIIKTHLYKLALPTCAGALCQ